MRQRIVHSFERIKGLAWLMKVDHHGDQLNTQLTEMICRQVPCSKVTTNYCHLFAKLFPSHFPHHDRWVPLFSFTSSKRVTNTWYSSSEDKSKFNILRTWERRGLIPKWVSQCLILTSPLKENSVSFMFRESERKRKKTPKGSFFV